jgi:uncharacterized protein YqgC (DUF456 family)
LRGDALRGRGRLLRRKQHEPEGVAAETWRLKTTTASGFAASVAKIGATLGVFVLPILKGKFGVPAVLGMVVGVSILGLVVTLVFGREDVE